MEDTFCQRWTKTCFFCELCFCNRDEEEESKNLLNRIYNYDQSCEDVINGVECKESIYITSLKSWIRCTNAWACIVHGLQAIITIVLLLVLDPLRVPTCINRWDRRLGLDQAIQCEIVYNSHSGWYIFVFSLLACIDHYWTWLRMLLPRRATIVHSWSEKCDNVSINEFGNFWDGLDAFQNPYRWFEYQFSASFMFLLIAQMSGIVTITSHIALFFLTFTMNSFGFLMERTNSERMIRNARAQVKTGNSDAGFLLVDWAPYFYGWVPGAAIWFSIMPNYIQFFSEIPQWVFAIFVTLWSLFMSFAFVMPFVYRAPTLEERKDGITSRVRYYRGELAYQILSLIAKTTLVWQTLGGIL